jgi:hypothetical protein
MRLRHAREAILGMDSRGCLLRLMRTWDLRSCINEVLAAWWVSEPDAAWMSAKRDVFGGASKLGHRMQVHRHSTTGYLLPNRATFINHTSDNSKGKAVKLKLFIEYISQGNSSSWLMSLRCDQASRDTDLRIELLPLAQWRGLNDVRYQASLPQEARLIGRQRHGIRLQACQGISYSISASAIAAFDRIYIRSLSVPRI